MKERMQNAVPPQVQELDLDSVAAWRPCSTTAATKSS